MERGEALAIDRNSSQQPRQITPKRNAKLIDNIQHHSERENSTRFFQGVNVSADTKLVPSFMVGRRDLHTAKIFIDDLASRLATRVQFTTNGLHVYFNAVEGAFGYVFG